MSANLYYLMALLPTLPSAIGEKVDYSYAISKIKEDGSNGLSYLSDLLEAEKEIEQCGLQYYVLNNKSYRPVFSDSLQNEFTEAFESYKYLPESAWLTQIYKKWFELILKTGKKTGSGLLRKWAEWELTLRVSLMKQKPADLQEMVSEFKGNESAVSAASAYRSASTPFEAEKNLDQARIDYLRQSAAQFSFTIDELVAYMLELRIHNRYSTLRPEEGRRILEEVTKL